MAYGFRGSDPKSRENQEAWPVIFDCQRGRQSPDNVGRLFLNLQIPVRKVMKALFAVRTALVAAAALIVCVLMTGCGAGSSSPLMVPSVAASQNPLVAIYTIRTGCLGQIMVEFGPTTSYGRSTAWYPITTDFSAIEVAGMMASTTYHMRAQVQCTTGNGTTSTSPDTTFTTGPLPSSSSLVFPKLAVSRPNPSLSSTENPGIEYIDQIIANTPAYFTDRDGNVIWYYDNGPGNFAFPFKLLPNGNMLLSITNGVSTSTLREVDLAGNTIRELSTPTLQHDMANAESFDFVPWGFTHDFALLPNGHVIVILNCFKNFTDLPGYPGTTLVKGDALVDLDQNWNPVWTWNAFDHLDVNRHIDGLPDWTHSNTLLYSPDDGNLLLSMRNQSWILKIDYANGTGSGNVLWRLGYQGDFALSNEGVPSDDQSLWFANQHFPIILSHNGSQMTLGIFDNGDDRFYTGGAECRSPLADNGSPVCYSRPVTFQIDESSMVANITWADPLPSFGIWGGNINQFENGNVEFELNDPAIPPSPNLGSQVQEVTGTSTPQVVWQMNFFPAPGNVYRAYRVPSLYNGVTWQH
jgi:arylsulfate sulfotransferase